MIAVSDYELKVRMRIERLRARAIARRAEGNGRIEGARRLAERIPLGQPILVGHHSERKHRRDAKRIDDGMRAGFAALNEAGALERRVEAAENNPSISSDDPSAIEKLRAKLAEQEADHAQTLAGNKALRAAKGDEARARAALTALGIAPKAIESALIHNGGAGWFGFFAGNSNARIKATKARVALLERAAAEAPPAPENYASGKIGIEQRDNRVQVTFANGQPPAAVLADLKSHGFKWAPSVGSWQRFASDDAWYWARAIVRRLAAALPPAIPPHCDACGHELASCVCAELCDLCGLGRDECDCRNDPNNGADDE